MTIKHTERGFAIYDEFADSKRNTVSVQQSSSIEGGVWIFCENDRTRVYDQFGNVVSPSPHLQTIEQVDRLIAALEAAKADLFAVEWVDEVERVPPARLAPREGGGE